MHKDKSVTLERVSGRENEYIIKDNTGITAGRVFIIEMNRESRYCTLRLKFYKNNNFHMLKDALEILLGGIFKTKDIYKINIFVDESANTNAFTQLGFNMEGIVEDNIFSEGEYRSELLFGINRRDYEGAKRTNILRLKGKRIELKVLTPEDSSEMLDYYRKNREHLKDFEPARDESFYTQEVQKKILMESYKQFLNGTSINCGVYREKKLIGKFQISNIVYGIFRNAFIGYSIDKDEQGKGYAKEALKLLTDYAFEDLELHRIEASTLTDNLKSQRVLRSCGFEEIGLNREYLFINGAWRDHVTFCKVNRE